MVRIGPWISAAVVGAGLFFVVWRSQQPPEVTVIAVTREDIVATLAVSGRLEPVDGVDIGPPAGGLRIVRVLADLGDTVKAGDVLVQLESADLDARLQQAQSRIAQADANTQLAQVQAQGASATLALAQEDLTSLNSLRSARDAAQAQLRQAQARLTAARQALARTLNGGRNDAVQQAEAQLRRAEALAQQRARDAVRLGQLFAEGAISRQDREVADTALVTAREDVRSAREAVSLARTTRPEDIAISRANVREAESAVSGAAQAANLTAEALRRRLAPRQSVTTAQTQRDTALASARVAQAERTTAQGVVAEATALRERLTIRAPFAGRIASRFAEPGQTTALNQPLIRLTDDRRLRVRLAVDEANLQDLRIGMRAVVSTDAYPDITVGATVSDIAPAADFAQGTLEVRLKLDRVPPEFRPDLTIDANLEVAKYRGAIVVPREVLKTVDGKAVVYIAPQGKIVAVPITWKPGNLDQVVILSGLDEGALVILDPRATKPGLRVRPVKAVKDAVRR